jgi:hypothetical protein
MIDSGNQRRKLFEKGYQSDTVTTNSDLPLENLTGGHSTTWPYLLDNEPVNRLRVFSFSKT